VELTIFSDREVLSRTLLEVEHLLATSLTTPDSMESRRSQLRARVRVLWLLQHLCSSHLSSGSLQSIRYRSHLLQVALRHVQDSEQILAQTL
jgi:hypothetical protein